MPIKINGTNTAANPSITGSDTDTGIVYGSDQIDFSIGGSSKLTLDPSGRLLLGTTTEGISNGDDLTIATSGHTGLTIRSGTSSQGNIFFSDGTSGTAEYKGYLQYEHTNNALLFGTDATERMRIDSSGSVGIGTTSPSTNLHVHTSANDSGITVKSTGNTSNAFNLDANRSGANAGIGSVKGRWNGTTVAQISFNTGSDTTNKDDGYVWFGTESAASNGNVNATERMRIAPSGNVGIGTTSPLKKLHIADAGDVALMLQTTNATNDKEIFEISCAGNASNDADLIFRTRVNAGTGGSEVMRLTNSGKVGIGEANPSNIIHATGSNSSVGYQFINTHATDGFGVRIAGGGTTADRYALRVDDAAENELFRVNANGNCGIGTSTPFVPLDVRGANNTTFDHVGTINLQGTDAYNSGNAGAGINFTGKYNSSGNTTTLAQISGIKADTSDGTFDGALIFGVRNDAQGLNIERMRVTSSGAVLIGMTSESTTTQGMMFRSGDESSIFRNSGVNLLIGGGQSGQKLVEFRHNGSGIGNITKSGTTGIAYNTSSDYRLKENAVAISDGITRLKTLKPYKFNFKADPSTTVDGFFAHEVTAVPEAITGTKDEVDENNEPVYQGIDQSKLVPLLVAALQEAIGRIEALEAK